MKKVLVFILLLALLSVLYSLDLFSFTNPAEVKKLVLSYGVYAPIIFIILFTFVPLTLFPDAILAIAGGLIFGLVQGSLYIMIGAVLGATLSFFLARFYSDWLRNKLQSEKFLNIDKSVKQNGFLIIFLLRLIPLVPFDIISYSAGFSSVRYKDFIFATLLGIIPGVVVYANIGAQSLKFGSNNFYFSIALLIGLIVLSLFFKKSVKKRLENEDI
jgi:uncharacterized membrane protein YdjX (TVP38/TMEM64 family)